MQLTPEELAKRAGKLGQKPGVIYSAPGMPGTTSPPIPSIGQIPTPKTRVPELDQNPTQRWRSNGNAALNRAAQFDENTANRLAAESAARKEAMRTGGPQALERVMAEQEKPAFRRTPDAPGGPPQQASAPRPTASPAATPQAAAPAAPAAGGAGAGQQAIGALKRVGNLAKGTVAGAVATDVIGTTFGKSLSTPTEEYYQRLGMDPNDISAGRDVAARTVGVLADIGDSLIDTGKSAANWLGDRVVRTVTSPVDTLFGDIKSIQDGVTGAYDAAKGLFSGSDPAAPAAGGGQSPSTQPQTATPQEPVAQQPSNEPAEQSGAQSGSQGAGAGQKDSDVVGTFNGREITRGEANRLAGQNGGVPGSVPAVAAGGALGAMPAAPAPADFRGNDRSNRLSTQRGAEKRLAGLYAQYNDLMSRGRRRNAAVVADLIGKELGVVQGLAGTQTQQGQQPQGTTPQDIAEMGRIQALTEGAQMDNRAKALLQQTLMDSLDETKTPEQREAARQRLAAMRGETGQQRDPKIVDVPGADGISTMPARVNADGTYTVLQPSGGAAGGAAGLVAAAQNAIAKGADKAQVEARLLEQLMQAQGSQ